MKARHTPGIWKANYIGIGRISHPVCTITVAGSTNLLHSLLPLPALATVWNPLADEFGNADNDDEMKANARLIAAAPLLFSALQRIVRNGYLVDDVPDDVLNHALQALEQVEGDE